MYVMSCFHLPRGSSNEIKSLLSWFWLGDDVEKGSLHWVAWETLCMPKNVGGMGFRNLGTFNKAMLAKHWWRLLQFPDSLAPKIIKAKYYLHCDVFHAKNMILFFLSLEERGNVF